MSTISLFAWLGLIYCGLTLGTIWVVIIVGGVILIALAMFIVSGMLAAHLKAESVEINHEQLPELYEQLVKGCQQLNMHAIPRLFVMQSNGLLNAFAMRHARRDFVVLLSDFLEAFPLNSPQIAFIIGHELGHINRKHISKSLFILPSTILPLLGFAYHRACESTCDRYGAFVAQDTKGGIQAMLALAGGKQLCQNFDAHMFAKQYEMNRGFFVSLHELLSNYPTLSKRVSDLITLHNQSPEVKARRNLFSHVCSMVIPSAGIWTILVIYIAIIMGLAITKKPEEPVLQQFEEQFEEQ